MNRLTFKKKPLGLIDLGRSTMTYYPYVGNSVVFTYPVGSTRELEIIDEELFTKELINFIITNKLVPATVMIVLVSDLLYEKDFFTDDENKKKEEVVSPTANLQAMQSTDQTRQMQTQANNEERLRQIKLFIDAVPFEETASKTYKVDKGVKVLATNKALFSCIRKTFIKQGFAVDAVVPITMLGKEFADLKMLNQETAKKILSRYEMVKQNSLLEENTTILGEVNIPTAHHIQLTRKVSSKREYALIGLFTSLMLVLGYVSYTTFFPVLPEKKIASINLESTPTPPITPIASVSATPVASSSASAQFDKAALRMQLNGGTAIQADLFRQQLANSGFTTVTVSPNNVPATGKALVIFSDELDPAIREQIVAEVSKSVLTVSVQENTLTGFDVVINL